MTFPAWGRRRFRGLGAVCVLAASLLLAAPPRLPAQTVEETRTLREAAALEARGDYDGAERVLRGLLAASPASSGGLFALERVLRAKGDVVDILPAVDTFLAHDASAAGVRYLKLRVLSDADSADAVRREGEAWIHAQPTSEAPYREVSRIYQRTFGPERGLEVIRRGRSALGRPDALALEAGDLQVAAGHPDAAVEEWAKAVGKDGAQVTAVSRRLTEMKQGREDVAARLVEVLGRAGEPGRRRAGALLALDQRLAGPALTLSRKVADELQGRPRIAFLSDVARRARDAELADVASWAYGALGQDARSPGERRQFDQRLVEMSLADGDTVTALEAQRRLVASFTPGSVDRRKATVEQIRLEAGSATVERLRAMLDAFAKEFPGSPDLDEVTSTVAGALLAQGDAEGAKAVLSGSQGPRSALQRGYLLLDDGDVEGARLGLLAALPGLAPSEATGVIQFVSLLGRLSPASAEVLGRAEALAHAGKGGAAATTVEDALGDLPEKERPALLAEAARLAGEGGEPATAAALRRRLVDGYPDADESAEAMLELARYKAGTPDGVDEAIQLLEALVTSRPDAAVVPDARRELEKLRRRGT